MSVYGEQLFDALLAAGFKPRDPNHEGGTFGIGRYHRSTRTEKIAERALIFNGARSGRYDCHLDHREDWTRTGPLGEAAWRGRTWLMTWHVHGCLHEGRPAHLPTSGHGGKGPDNQPWAWCGPSWYAPHAIVGVAWTDRAPEIEDVIRPFRVDGL